VSQSRQHTVAAAVICSGVGLHSGDRVRITVRPAAANSGIVFVRTDLQGIDNRVPAKAECVRPNQPLCTILSNAAGVTVATVEHLMAALAALDIDNALVEVDGPELPIMDGSSAPFVTLLDRAGRRRQDAPRRYIEVLAPVEVVQGDKRATLTPAAAFEVAFEIAFPSAAIGRQRVELAVDEDSFRAELADCRTFGFIKDVEALRAQGLARGGSLENAVVIDGDRVLNPEGLRRPDEFVRHKALDAVGDLYLLGAPMLGRFEGIYAGHALNNLLARALLANPAAWRLWTMAEAHVEELAEAV
jgi:UDP-3-O-[3-hydroxymyristoyl] N-acetylglucosamine deacetylase